MFKKPLGDQARRRKEMEGKEAIMSIKCPLLDRRHCKCLLPTDIYNPARQRVCPPTDREERKRLRGLV